MSATWGPDRDVASDSLCGIVSVTVYGKDHTGPCLGELRSDLGEALGIFSFAVLEQAEEARASRSRVLLDVRKSRAGHRYVHGLQRLAIELDPTPCLRCGTLAPKVAATPETPEHFRCGQCHSLWFVQPITRSYR